MAFLGHARWMWISVGVWVSPGAGVRATKTIYFAVVNMGGVQNVLHGCRVPHQLSHPYRIRTENIVCFHERGTHAGKQSAMV